MKKNKKLSFMFLGLTPLPLLSIGCVEETNTTDTKKKEIILVINQKLGDLSNFKNSLVDEKYNELKEKIELFLANIDQENLNNLNLIELTQIKNSIEKTIEESNVKKQQIDNKQKKDTNPKTPEEESTPPSPNPQFPPNFPNFENAENHKYPEYVNKFKKVDSNILYKEIYDRTFSIKFGTKISNSSFISNDRGTGWLLDYHKFSNSVNKYKLFIATNLHVLANFSNSLDESLNKKLNYYDPADEKVVAIGLGKTKNKPNNFDNIDNLNGPNIANQNNWIAKYFTNSKELESYDHSERILDTKFSEAISQPKIVFAAFDFMKDEANANYQDNLKAKALERYEYLKNNDLLDEEYFKPAYENYFKEKKLIPMMVDMAIFEIDIDLEKADSTLKTWVEEAISALDSYLDRIKNTDILPNQDKNISKYMLTTDYVSALKKAQNKNNLFNLENIFIGGYPYENPTTSYWIKNNPSERWSKDIKSYNRSPVNEKTFALPKNNWESKLEFGNNLSIFDKSWRRIMASWYGYHYNVNFSSLYYGASGSLAYNEFGQMIGIYDAVTSSVSSGDLLQYGGVAPFIQSHDLEAIDGSILYAYNLIDATDKEKYSKQKNSFRENLKILYPNGFEDGENTTKLFDNGY